MTRWLRVTPLALLAAVLVVLVSGASPAPPHVSAAETVLSLDRSPTNDQPVAVLDAVACPAPGDCIAVGYLERNAGGDNLPLAERWNGSTWSLMTVPRLLGQANPTLTAISCPTVQFCLAVGDGVGPTGEFPQASRAAAVLWNGTSWRLTQLASGPVGLVGVACSSAAYCLAVGFGAGQALTELWNGNRWRLTATPDATDSQFSAVSCSVLGNCVAVGVRDVTRLYAALTTAIALRWQGTSWTVVKLPRLWLPSGQSHPFGYSLSAVSCAGASFCRLVGKWQSNALSASLVEGLDGHASSLIPVPGGSVLSADASPTGVAPVGEPFLTGVSCPSPSSCTAVGNNIIDGNIKGVCGGGDDLECPFTESWNGRSWSMSSTRANGPAEFLAVSCASSKDCVAVGAKGGIDIIPPIRATALAEHWNGARWSVMTTPRP